MPFRKMLCHTKHDYLLPRHLRLWKEMIFLLFNVTHLSSSKRKNLFKELLNNHLFIQLKALCTNTTLREVFPHSTWYWCGHTLNAMFSFGSLTTRKTLSAGACPEKDNEAFREQDL